MRFSTGPRAAVDWDLICRHWPDLMQAALSVKHGTVSSVTLLCRLNNRSRKNQIYQAIREVGLAVRIAVLFRYPSDPSHCANRSRRPATRPRPTTATRSGRTSATPVGWLSATTSCMTRRSRPRPPHRQLGLLHHHAA
ncbi:Tn3 family transposase [Streptomyces sp. NPDC053431]|uniref:Tn3 family transposase n=1 Tax=Streptomyces sp. NPDC053431 TaxID=3365703 RepID=UPI0037CE575D